MKLLLSALWVLVLLAGCGAATTSPTSIVTASTPPATTPLAVRPSEVPVSERPNPAATASATAAPEPGEGWSPTTTIDISPGTSFVIDVVHWSGGWLAIGSEWESEFHVNSEMPAMWTSDDGRSWQAHPADLGVTDVTLIGVVERADGRLLMVGRVPGSGAVAEPAEPRNVAWVSGNATEWEAAELPLSGGASLASLDHGPKGYVLTATTPYTEFDPNADQTPGEIWYSADGIAWTKTHEGAAWAVAGDDGFVAIQSALAAGPSHVVASADGKTWYASELVGAPLFDVAPVGGDWVATAAGEESGSTQVLHSENGLTWSPVLDVNDLTGPDGPKTGRGLNELAINSVSLVGGHGYAFLMLGNNHCCAQMGWTYGVWVTTDGATWTQAIWGNASVSAVAEADGLTVLGGHLGRGEDATFWVAK